MSGDGIEIERKYDVEAGIQMPSLVGIGPIVSADASEEFALDASYFDTAELDLAQARVAVRRRFGGHDAGWHIKWPPEAEGRREQQFPLSTGESAATPPGARAPDAAADETGPGDPAAAVIPDAVLEALGTLAAGKPLRPIARIRNRRVATVLRGAAGEPLIELADDHVEATDLRDGVVRRWQEWEAELLEGAPSTREGRDALLDVVEAALVAAGARAASSGSKLARALGAAG